jgi:hypothetical protein
VKRIVAWLQTAKWIVYLVGIGAVLVLFLILRRFLSSKGPTAPNADGSWLPEVSRSLQEQVKKAEESSVKSRIEARVTAEKDKAALERVLQIEESDRRREELAALLNRL